MSCQLYTCLKHAVVGSLHLPAHQVFARICLSFRPVLKSDYRNCIDKRTCSVCEMMIFFYIELKK